MSIRSLFILLKKVQAVVKKTSRKNVTSIFFYFFFSFLWKLVEKSQSTRKNCT